MNKIGEGKGPKPGRPKGSVNKTTALLKDAILQAAENAGGRDGLVGYLQKQATSENPAPFMALLGKVLPMQIAGSLTFENVSKDQRDAAVAAATRADG